jgi:hypothetical protein
MNMGSVINIIVVSIIFYRLVIVPIREFTLVIQVYGNFRILQLDIEKIKNGSILVLQV